MGDLMTVLVFLAGLTAGLPAGAYTTYRFMCVRCDLHGYRKVALEAARVRQVYAEADHEHRLRLRIEASTAELRLAVGDLLDTVQAKDRQIDRLCRRRNSVPAYGSHR